MTLTRWMAPLLVVTTMAAPAEAEGAIDHLLAAAEKGDAKAQATLAMHYYKGKGVAKDDTAAVRWFRQAAMQGHLVAQHNLGYMRVRGEGGAQDVSSGAAWLKKAASRRYDASLALLTSLARAGEEAARLELAELFLAGAAQPGPGDMPLVWLRDVADTGDARALALLGRAYAKGHGEAGAKELAGIYAAAAAGKPSGWLVGGHYAFELPAPWQPLPSTRGLVRAAGRFDGALVEFGCRRQAAPPSGTWEERLRELKGRYAHLPGYALVVDRGLTLPGGPAHRLELRASDKTQVVIYREHGEAAYEILLACRQPQLPDAAEAAFDEVLRAWTWR